MKRTLSLTLIFICFSVLMPENALSQRNKKSKKKDAIVVVQPRGTRVTKVAGNSIKVVYRGVHYHYAGGVYYRLVGAEYVVVAPKPGLRIPALPPNYVVIHIGPIPYYYHNGVFYKRMNQEYEVVEPPVGAIVSELPEGYRVVIVENSQYYELDGFYYREVIKNGKTSYEVVDISSSEKPVELQIGTFVPSLPDGYETITIAEETLFLYGGVYYKEVYIDDYPYYEVVGKQ